MEIPENMRAMVLAAVGEPLRLREVPVPRPGTGQVLIKVHACGVCRTDLHIVDGELSAPKLPLIPGHEVVGTVAETDPDACFYLANFTKQPCVSTFQSGDRGKIATYFARWITRGSHQGDSAPIPGPWSDPVSMYVA